MQPLNNMKNFPITIDANKQLQKNGTLLQIIFKKLSSINNASSGVDPLQKTTCERTGLKNLKIENDK